MKRAKLRAMHLLNDMDRTESQLRTKLLNGDYPADIADEAIAYVKSFGYINDESYIRRFIESRKNSKSKKEIYALLMKKGVDMERVQEILSEYYSAEDSLNAIRDLLRKRDMIQRVLRIRKCVKYTAIWQEKDLVMKISVK